MAKQAWSALVTAAVLAAALLFGGASPALAQPVIVSCPFGPAGSGDNLDRGFYVTNYQAYSLDTATLRYFSSPGGFYQVTLTARAGSFAGPLVGVASASFVVSAGSEVQVVFDFGDAPVAFGSTIAFSQSFTGPSGIFFNVGTGALGGGEPDPCPGVTETEGTLPPLDTFRRDTVGLVLTGSLQPVPLRTGAGGGAVGAVAVAAAQQAQENRARAAAAAQPAPAVSAPRTGTGVTPPNTGDAGLLDRSGSRDSYLLGGLAALSFGGLGLLALRERRAARR
ncbi:MAG TPA: hypothetical protein VNN10_15685 [Dehalococcoidia bacterium]|nr:hypothetical protein [Dehalococcoidia bacterium]